MNTPSPHCEEMQMLISEALDDNRALPAAVTEHVHGCAECEAFLAFWTEGMGRQLAQPLPPADLRLREKILALPKEAHAAGHTPQAKRHHYRGVLSACAAVAVFGLTAHVLLDVRPASDTPVPERAHADKLVKSELKALRADLRKGASALRGPVSTLKRVID